MPLGRTASGQSKKLVALAPASKRVQEYLEDPQGTATRLGLASAVDASTDAVPHPKHIVVSNIGGLGKEWRGVGGWGRKPY